MCVISKHQPRRVVSYHVLRHGESASLANAETDLIDCRAWEPLVLEGRTDISLRCVMMCSLMCSDELKYMS